MTDISTLGHVRREYGNLYLNEQLVQDNPLAQFQLWFEEVLSSEKTDPTAMVLSTVDERGFPDSRVVLLKGLENESFIFYTNYESNKAQQIQYNTHVALNFYWPTMSRQVRVRGIVQKTTSEQSDAYFASRPITSQLSAMASMQSREIADRQSLEISYQKLIEKFEKKTIIRPETWGGYLVIPEEIEFWQGRDNRLHDRIHYFRHQEKWLHHRLAP